MDDSKKTPPGIQCPNPNCGCRHFLEPVWPDWATEKTEKKFGYIRRRRVCRNCGRVIYTRETIEHLPEE